MCVLCLSLQHFLAAERALYKIISIIIIIVDTTDGSYRPAQLKATHRRPWPDLVLFYMVLFVHRIPEVLSRTGKRGWGGGRGEEPGSARRHWIACSPKRSDPQRPKSETASHRQNNHVKEVGTPPVRSDSCSSQIGVSAAVRSKVTKTVIVRQLLRIWLECCFTSTETVGLLGTGAQDGHLDFHTPPELWLLKDNSAARQTVQLREFSSTSLLLISTGLC